MLTYANGDPHDRWHSTRGATVTGNRVVLPELVDWIEGRPRPVCHLDFETIGAPLPLVLHTRPVQVVPLQYSVHIEQRTGWLKLRPGSSHMGGVPPAGAEAVQACPSHLNSSPYLLRNSGTQASSGASTIRSRTSCTVTRSTRRRTCSGSRLVTTGISPLGP
jgi:hypothetical protein